MKKFLFITLVLTSLKTVAAPVFLFPNCSPFNNECTLYNTSGYDVNCSIRVEGFTKSGRYLSAFEFKYLYQGMFAWVRVYNSDFNDPTVSLRADASCNTMN